jgi:hypothetical protein
VNEESEFVVASPAESGVNPYFMLGCLMATLKGGESITVDVWNEAIEAAKEQKK